MPTFLLITVPFCTIDHRYFAAAYLAGIVRNAGWLYRFLDLNILTFQACSSDGKMKPRWNVSNQVKLYADTKAIGHEVLRKALKNEIEAYKPDLIGFSLMSSNRLYGQLALEVLADLQIDIPVIYGGPDCFPREYYKEYFQVPYVPDIMLQGEAEIALPEFLQEYEYTQSVQTRIKGFIYRNNDGELVDTGMPVISYLRDDNLPADYSVFDYLGSRYDLDNTVFTFCSKGCINKCAFCSESRNYQPYRRRQAQEVIGDIRDNLKKIPAEFQDRSVVVFRDSIFNASPKYVKKICELLIQYNMNIKWFCLGGFRIVLSDDIFELMKQSGCKNIFFGFESASQRVADLMGKNFKVSVAQQTIDQCLLHGISVTLPIINGFPGEFTRDFLTSMAFILRYRDKVDFGYSNTCGIFKKTPLSSNPDDFLIKKVDEVNYELRDGYNIFPVRQLRQILNSVLCHHDRLDRNDALLLLDFNVLPVASEVAQIIYCLSIFLGRRVHDDLLCGFNYCDLSETENEESSERYEYLSNIIPGVSLVEWLRFDKNEVDVKKQIISFLAELIGDFENKILLEKDVNFYDFRNSLYNFTGTKLSINPPAGFMISSERFSEYDKGGHVIFEGTIAHEKWGKNISAVEARCGNYCFDIHHWTGDPFHGTGTTNIWGKVGSKMIRENPLEIKITYSDNRTVLFEFPFTIIETIRTNTGIGLLSSIRHTIGKLF